MKSRAEARRQPDRPARLRNNPGRNAIKPAEVILMNKFAAVAFFIGLLTASVPTNLVLASNSVNKPG
jgi:hypothetical protein